MIWTRPVFVFGLAFVSLSACAAGRFDDDAVEVEGEAGAGGEAGSPAPSGSGGKKTSPTDSAGGRGGDTGAGGMTPASGGAGGGSGGKAGGSGGSGGKGGGSGGTGGAVGGMAGTGSIAGMAASGGAGGMAGTSMPPPDWKPTLMAVGYGGMRVASQDNGVTWKRVAQLTRDGGDDRELLRAIAFGKSRWIAAGWRMFTSTDGSTWVEGKNPEGCGLMEGAAFGNGTFVATCGEDAFLSDDGLTWRRGGRVGSTSGHTYVLFANGVFAASGDSGNSYTSSNGSTWTALSGVRKVRFCQNEFRSETACAGEAWFASTFYRGAWKGKIDRSPTGSSWTTVYTDDWSNSVYRFGQGMMPPFK